MEIERQRVQDDLRGIVAGEVYCDPLMTQLYASDASIYQLQPLGVVRPRSTQDVLSVVQYAAEHEISIHPRGAGTGVSGESLGRGIVIDFSQSMRRIESDPDDLCVKVQSGAALAVLNRNLSVRGRWYGPDPVTRSVTTIGGVLSTNASGSHYLRSGSARDTVESLSVVTVDGELVECSKHHPEEGGPQGRFARGLTEINHQFKGLIEGRKNAPQSRGGYRFDGIIDADGSVDLAKFMVGTQGTLGIIVDAKLRTEQIPRHRGVILLFFHRLDSAARSGVNAIQYGPVACDLMDRRLLQIARETSPELADVLPREAEAMLLVELQGESLAELTSRLNRVKDALSRGTEGAFAGLITTEREERNRYWALSRRVIPRLHRVKGNAVPVPFTEDVCVTPESLPDLITAIQDTLKRNQATATIFSHVGHGQLHLRPFLNLGEQKDRDRLRPLSEQIAEVVWKHGGEISVEHPAGLSRSYLLPKQYGDLWQAIGQVKRLFDPNQRLNPGKLFAAEAQKPDENLRPANSTIEIVSGNRVLVQADANTLSQSRKMGQTAPQLQVLQQWPAGKLITDVTRSCNGCARCRTTSASDRQCPVFRATAREEATPRAKANLLRGVLSGQLSVDDLTGDRAKSISDLCFQCHQCRLECPASVDIPKIVSELRAQYVATNGLPLSDALIARIDNLASVFSAIPWISNRLMRSPFVRWMAESLFDFSAARELPRFAPKTFLRYASARRWNRPQAQGDQKVAYFVDLYANHFDTDVGRALGEVLQQNGIGLYVPSSQSASGISRLNSGDVRNARKIARKNVRLLADAVRQGYHIVATEPSALLCLKHEYPNLLDDEDAHLVAEHSSEACAYLWDLHQSKQLNLDFSRVDCRIAYHQPCHLRVLDPECCATKLLSLIPGIEVENIDAGCSGMAGTWGLQRKNYRSSLRIGWPVISKMRSARVSIATTECSACKMQIEHGSDRTTLHPLKLVAHAYGRMPKIQSQLSG